jgi:hypothetical protein
MTGELQVVGTTTVGGTTVAGMVVWNVYDDGMMVMVWVMVKVKTKIGGADDETWVLTIWYWIVW